jgi:hypothetical protein
MFLRWNDGSNGGRGVMIKIVIVVMIMMVSAGWRVERSAGWADD